MVQWRINDPGLVKARALRQEWVGGRESTLIKVGEGEWKGSGKKPASVNSNVIMLQEFLYGTQLNKA